jgi:hypothetical protein
LIGVAPPAMKIDCLTAAITALALSFAAAGCGSSVSTCGIAPCGGDVVGSWKAETACLDHATLEKDFLAGVRGSCPTASIGAVSMTPVGTLELAADMSFRGALVVNSTMDVIHPAACVNGASCGSVTEVLQSNVGANGVTSVSCVGSGSCTCRWAQTIDIINATGTWATSGTMLTFAGAPGGNGPYCVQGSSLHLVGFDLATMTRIVSDIVLSKQ